MKYLVRVIRFFVGIIFIISGFVKLIDPMGFSFKLQDYFAPDVLNIPFFMPFSYAIALFMVTFEIVLGVMLLLGYQRKITIYLLLLLTVFFGFLTFYSAYYNKVTDCGCFGDAVKFTPWQSFTKDMFLLVLVLFLLFGQKFIKPIFNNRISIIITIFSILFCGIFAYYTNKHLPIIDFRPYKIGNNIQQGMIIPDNAPKAVFNYYWKFKIGDKEKIITTQGAYPDVDGEFVDVVTELISKGYQPPIHDFTIEKNGEDYTKEMLDESKLMMIISYDLDKANLEGFKCIKTLTDRALRKGYKVIGMTASMSKTAEIIKEYELNFDFYFTDQTTLKTIIRSNPAVMIVEKGTIVQKANYRDADKIDLKP
ncbi:BT_3928 family protein [Capnocytophaga catalasegens]|uniref:Methylamine utilisation protein MauE domain-containing protein n=1 Tax=Capnocytophaga catalasegens TaxID=1004260 RepID=A0AAV5ATP2_9FLAO|nr:BT_3928 family protein [Capnocytophaga catalasegens]GIZ14130.1 hypothetical protein RCZ03_01310 [Capnocytophaga catalasegens]GJM49924.1 hypothetical protein RCZ15_08990 [Capnocytophaga catalasegens]GJM51695.1 hypothetical protein RCZ16_00130 [Capnocytophaga catalasegens]